MEATMGRRVRRPSDVVCLCKTSIDALRSLHEIRSPAAITPSAEHGLRAKQLIQIEIIDDAAAFARLRPEWNALLASSRSDCVFLTWEWLHTWWKELSDGRHLFIVTVRRDSRLVALAPLSVSRLWPSVRRLEFLGIGSVGS